MQTSTLAVRGFLLVALLVFVSSRWLTLDSTILNIDEASYAAAAVRAIDTDAPIMKNSRDNKPPGIYAVYALTFEAFGNYNMRALRWVAAAWVAATALVIGFWGARWMGLRFGALAGGFFLLTSSLDLRFVAFKTEVMANLPLALAIGFVVESVLQRRLAWAVVAGVCGGLAMCFRQPSVLILAAVVLGAAWHLAREPNGMLRALGLMAAIALGMVATAAAVALYFHQVGALDELLLQTFALPADFAGDARFSLMQRLMRFVTYLEEYARNSQLLFAFAAAGWVLCVMALFRPPAGPGQALLVARAMALGLVGALLAFAAAPDMFHAYFLQLYIPLSFAFAVASEQVLQASSSPPGRSSAGSVVLLSLVAIASGSAAVLALKEPIKLALGQSHTQDRPLAPLVQRVAETAQPGDRLFVWGFRPQLYVATRLPPATRFTLTDVVVGSSGDVGRRLDPAGRHFFYEAGGWAALMEELERERPRFIADAVYMAIQAERRPIKDFPALAAFVERHYAPVASLGENLTLYERRVPR